MDRTIRGASFGRRKRPVDAAFRMDRRAHAKCRGAGEVQLTRAGWLASDQKMIIAHINRAGVVGAVDGDGFTVRVDAGYNLPLVSRHPRQRSAAGPETVELK